MGDLNLCYGCMNPKTGNGACPKCGYQHSKAAKVPNALKAGSQLHDRYIVGKVMENNGEGITYLAYDTNIGCKVAVREYLPIQLCTRVKDSTLLNVDYNHLAQYKSLMAEYTELNKSLARQRSLVHLNPALDLFAENNTTYAVYEFLEGRSLLDYLKENAGELSWRTVSRMSPPLFTTLSILHNAGVLHRGISPETIFVTDKGDLKLTGFCISAVRTRDSELKDELFDGYAAPEQYFANRQQGTWTDVYGICAVLYRILTGCRATDANTRQNYDNLIPPHDLNPHVPKNVSEGIMRGLALDSNQRIRTITDLVTILFESGETEEAPASAAAAQHRSGTTTTFQTVSAAGQKKSPAKSANGTPVRKNPQKRPAPIVAEEEEEESALVSLMDRIRVPILIAVLVFVIFIVVWIAFRQTLNHGGNEPMPNNAESTTSASNIIPMSTEETTRPIKYDSVMPSLIGMNFQVKKSQMAGWLDLEPVYEFNDEYPKDQIFDQELKEGDGFQSGSKVQVKVSLGSSKKNIPDFEGFKLQAYLGKLKEMGFVEAVEDVTDKKKSKSKATTTTVTTFATAHAVGTSTTSTTNNLKQAVVFRARSDAAYGNGFVCGVEPGVGSAIDLQKDYTIIVYYVQGAETSYSKTSKTTTTTTTTATGKTGTSSTATSKSSAASTESSPPATQATNPTTAEPPQTAATNPPPPQTAATEPPPPPPQQQEGGGNEGGNAE